MSAKGCRNSESNVSAENCVEVRSDLLQNEVKDWLSSHWSGKSDSGPSEKWGISLLSEPFKICTLTNLISDHAYLEKLKVELLSLEFQMKNNDLYQYRQSEDLFGFDLPAINSFRCLLNNTIRQWLEDVTNIQLREKISANCSCYDDTDYLLCHDDQCEDRCIAYIFYLNRNWTAHDGGALQLFNTMETEPGNIVKSILPQFNSFVFFEVSEISFHQVQEVFTMDRTRITVNGWFYGSRKIKRREHKLGNNDSVAVPLLQVEDSFSSNVINSVYYNGDELLKTLNLHFEKTSSIMLEDFLCKEFYDSCCEALSRSTVSWLRKRPVNYWLYDTADESTLSSEIQGLLTLMKSEKLFQLLSVLTCLDLTCIGKMKKSCDKTIKVSACSYEIRRWKSGYYSLVNDTSFSKESLLDVTLYLNCENCSECGGSTVYISPEEEEELLCASPRPNSLSVTYRESNTACFVKYINHNFRGDFYTINFSCVEQA
ncbi:prolyl 3-hydroxylase OGFOD1 [Schistocerca cancellata]|uniref:prolyl 3-hydroxylase OGFOD1 n=1 Tax=Schistocerca cancellata TaxID=274614 RepID=UPI0021191D8D|nr:prolyl 3-hydroxylase OGFOD1 [Schistocerca cancellata]